MMRNLDRITFDPEVMGGKPCLRGLRLTVGAVVGLLAAGKTKEEVIRLYPYLEPQDIDQALAYAAWRVEEIDLPLKCASLLQPVMHPFSGNIAPPTGP